MRSRLAIAAAAALGLGLVPAAAGAQAQQSSSYPWERQADRYYQRGAELPSYDPGAESERALRKLGLKPNKPLEASGGATPVPPKVAAGRRALRVLDTNHDGSVSQSELLHSRVRPAPGGGAARIRSEVARSRSLSQFRAADRDRDGKLTPEELGELRGYGF